MTAVDRSAGPLPLIGWRERLVLPELGVTSVKAKIDTGARSSALHAFDIEFFSQGDADFVRFKVHSAQHNNKKTVAVEAKLLEMRAVRSSSGQAETRPVIQTMVATRDQTWPIELTLTNRDMMGFRMLLGRQAVRRRFLVDSGRSYLQSDAPKRKLKSGSKKRQKKTIKSSQKITHEDSNFIEKLRALFNPTH
ncbi:MAG: RimK/LysX family protein [Cyanobacteria bacterium J06559_1]